MPTLAAGRGLSTTFQQGNRQPHQWLATTFRELFKAYPQVADPSQFLRLNGSSGAWTGRETSTAHSSRPGRKRRRNAQTVHNEAMCLLALGWMHHPRWRLVMTGNRDEFHARPTAALAPGRMRAPSSGTRPALRRWLGRGRRLGPDGGGHQRPRPAGGPDRTVAGRAGGRLPAHATLLPCISSGWQPWRVPTPHSICCWPMATAWSTWATIPPNGRRLARGPRHVQRRAGRALAEDPTADGRAVGMAEQTVRSLSQRERDLTPT